MAATKTVKNRTSRNDTPNTPDVSESKIARMKVDELRRALKNRGVKGTEGLKKPDLVNKLIKAEGRSSSKSGRKNPASRNDTSNTPEVSQSKIGRMKASELRTRLARRGVKGTDDMKKPELVEKFVKTELKSAKSGKSGSSSAKSGRKNSTSRNDTPNTPEISESKIGRMKVSELRTRLARQGVGDTAGLKKPELVKKLVKSLSGSAGKAGKAGKARNAGKAETAGKTSGGKRTGKKSSPSLKYSQEITSTSDRPERAGRSLVTTDHEVIRQWAKSRRAVPATVAGTQHDGHLGVLRFDFPGYSGDRLVEVSWAEWFDAFDKRRLNFIYQEQRSGGERSNFFQLENPDE